MTLLHPILIGYTLLVPMAFQAPDRDKLIGTWQMTKSDGKDVELAKAAAIEFGKDGSVKQAMKIGEKTIRQEGKYTLDKDVLTMTLTVATTTGPKESTRTVKVISLTDTEMVLERESGGKKGQDTWKRK